MPEADLEQRKQELQSGAEMAGWTADTLERILSTDPLVTIDEVDEYGAPWFCYELIAVDGTIEYHSLTINRRRLLGTSRRTLITSSPKSGDFGYSESPNLVAELARVGDFEQEFRYTVS